MCAGLAAEWLLHLPSSPRSRMSALQPARKLTLQQRCGNSGMKNSGINCKMIRPRIFSQRI
nr:C58 family peptidase [Bradyrhizobium sacchari]